MKFPHRSQLINIKCCVVYTNDSFFLLDFSFHKSQEFETVGKAKKKKKNEKKRKETIISCYARDSSHFFVFFLGTGELCRT